MGPRGKRPTAVANMFTHDGYGSVNSKYLN